MLIRPIATAAADSVSVRVGSTQKGEHEKKAPNSARQSQNITTTKD
jgi:hypothetical protein